MTSIPKQMPFRIVDGPRSLGCTACPYLKDCGGIQVREGVWDCFDHCQDCCERGTCDLTCPNGPHFVPRWRDALGWPPAPPGVLLPPLMDTLPRYVPLIHHGKRRKHPLHADTVAVPLSRLLRFRGGYGTVRTDSPASIRELFQLGADTRILVVSANRDRHLEALWHSFGRDGISAKLAALQLDGVTLPNHSLFLDKPRMYWLWNRERTLRIGEGLSAQGVPVIPHLNAATSFDWDHWFGLLREQPRLHFVAKEFRTGLRRLSAGRRAIDALARLQDRLNRPLHPIVIGAARYYVDFSARFDHYTVIDSTPFFKTVYRQALSFRMDGGRYWTARHTDQDQPIDDLLDFNVHRYAESLGKTSARRDATRCGQTESERDAISEFDVEDHPGSQLVLPGSFPGVDR